MLPRIRILSWAASLMLGVLSGASLAQINTGPVDVLKPVLRPGIATLDILPIRPRTFTASCPEGAYVADVVAIDHPMVFNRIGAQNINWMMYALRHDVTDDKGQYPLDHSARREELFQAARSRHQSRGIALRPDLRPRPIVLRVPARSYLKVRLTNLLHVRPVATPVDDPSNPFKPPDPLANVDHPTEQAAAIATDPVSREVFHIDDQVHSRRVGFHPQGLELIGSVSSDSSYAGANPDSLVAPGDTREYCFYPKNLSYPTRFAC